MALTSVEREPGYFRNASPGLQALLLCVIAVILMALDHRFDYLTGARKTLAVVLYPVEFLVSAPFDLSRSLADSIATRSRLQAENARLREEALVQSARLQRMTAIEAENARLRALLDSTAKVGEDMLIAEIVSVDMNPFRNMIVINRGGQDGVYVGQPVLDADGVVGQIIRDRHWSAEAMLVTDIDHALPVELARNRLRTIAMGTGELDRLSLPFMPGNADVQEGDLLVTSGLGGKFPPGYPVATVIAVRSITGQPFLEIDAVPTAALNRIREVLLVKADEPAPANAAGAVNGPLTEEPEAGTGAAPDTADVADDTAAAAAVEAP